MKVKCHTKTRTVVQTQLQRVHTGDYFEMVSFVVNDKGKVKGTAAYDEPKGIRSVVLQLFLDSKVILNWIQGLNAAFHSHKHHAMALSIRYTSI